MYQYMSFSSTHLIKKDGRRVGSDHFCTTRVLIMRARTPSVQPDESMMMSTNGTKRTQQVKMEAARSAALASDERLQIADCVMV